MSLNGCHERMIQSDANTTCLYLMNNQWVREDETLSIDKKRRENGNKTNNGINLSRHAMLLLSLTRRGRTFCVEKSERVSERE